MLRSLAIATLVLLAATTARAGEGVRVELNKLEPGKDACRAYLVFENATPSAFDSLKFDLVLFDADGVVARRLAVEGGPLPARKTSVKLFDIAGLGCKGIGRILLNAVIACADDGVQRRGCLDLVSLSSRTAVPFVK